MKLRKFSREFKLEAVKLIKERGVAVAQAARDIDVAESVLRRWLREGVELGLRSAGLHVVAFVGYMLKHAVALVKSA